MIGQIDQRVSEHTLHACPRFKSLSSKRAHKLCNKTVNCEVKSEMKVKGNDCPIYKLYHDPGARVRHVTLPKWNVGGSSPAPRDTFHETTPTLPVSCSTLCAQNRDDAMGIPLSIYGGCYGQSQLIYRYL